MKKVYILLCICFFTNVFPAQQQPARQDLRSSVRELKKKFERKEAKEEVQVATDQAAEAGVFLENLLEIVVKIPDEEILYARFLAKAKSAPLHVGNVLAEMVRDAGLCQSIKEYDENSLNTFFLIVQEYLLNFFKQQMQPNQTGDLKRIIFEVILEEDYPEQLKALDSFNVWTRIV